MIEISLPARIDLPSPQKLTPFAELAMGHQQDGSYPDREQEESEYEEVRRMRVVMGRTLPRPSPPFRLGAGPCALFAIAATCSRGEVEFASRYIRRAYPYGMTPVQLLEAISCVLPMW